MIFDTDMGADDWMAALMLLRHPAVDLKAITVARTGLAHLEPGTEQALRLVKLAGKEGTVPVAKGLNEPREGEHAFPETWRLSADEMEGVHLGPSAQIPSEHHAVDTIISCSHLAERKLVVIAGAPLTNIAAALAKDSTLAERLQMIYCMGGAVDVRGNAPETLPAEERNAEWNIYLDPHAAAFVLSSGVPVTLVPLDATDYAPLTEDLHERLAAAKKTEWAAFVWKVLARRFETNRAEEFCFWDPLTVAVALDEKRFTTVEDIFLEVVVEEGPTCGQTRRVEEGGHRVRVCKGASMKEFEDFFLHTLNS
jgi:pyrimidine-specific ribonucleoside hydrolase